MCLERAGTFSSARSVHVSRMNQTNHRLMSYTRITSSVISCALFFFRACAVLLRLQWCSPFVDERQQSFAEASHLPSHRVACHHQQKLLSLREDSPLQCRGYTFQQRC